MPRAAHFFEPDLDSAGVLAKAKANGMSQDDIDEGHHWYNHYLQAAWNADPDKKGINVINRKADELWHIHKDTHPDYEDYCNACFGHKVNHISVDNPHDPDQAELDAVEPFYKPNWPVPDSIVACYMGVI